MTVTRGEASFTDTDSDQYILETPQPHARTTSRSPTLSLALFRPRRVIAARQQQRDATGVLTDPYVEDCVPDFFTLQGSPTLGAGWTAGTPLPSCGAGQTPLRFDYTGTLDPGDSTSEVTYVVQVDTEVPGPITPPGAYTNTATVRPPGGGSFGHCANTSPSCADTATVTVDPGRRTQLTEVRARRPRRRRVPPQPELLYPTPPEPCSSPRHSRAVRWSEVRLRNSGKRTRRTSSSSTSCPGSVTPQ